MKKILASPATRLLAAAGGFIAAQCAARELNETYDYYMRHLLNGFLNFLKLPIAVALLLFLVCAALFSLSVWNNRGKKMPFWRRADISYLAVLAWCAEFVCIFFVRRSRENSLRIFLLSLAVYTVFALIAAEVLSRLRDKAIGKTLYWRRFFRLYPLKKPAGFLMALVLAGIVVYLCVLCPVNILRTDPYLQTMDGRELLFSPFTDFPNPPDLTLYLFSLFALGALTYLCSFILTLSKEYEELNAEKVRAERFKAELITNVSHDIRTPLTSIINYVDLLKALPVERADFTEYVAILDKKAARLKTLIGDLMEASKAGTGNLSVELKEIDLPEIVGQIAGEFEDRFIERDLTLVLRQPEQPVTARADSGHLWRVLENLFGNAAKYALPGTRVFAEIALMGSRPVFALKNVSQTPIDIPAETLAEQFMRGDRSRHTEGSGLGLYIAKSLVELMGGEFAVRASGDLFEVVIGF